MNAVRSTRNDDRHYVQIQRACLSLGQTHKLAILPDRDTDRSVSEIGDEERSEHEQVRDSLIDRLGINYHPCRRHGGPRLFLCCHGELHEPGEEEGREQQHVRLQGRHLLSLY